MGITGLLPLLSSIQKPCNLKSFRGLTLGVDVYVWLHRAAVASAMDIGLGKPTTKFIAPVMHRVRMLLHFGITPYIVFDGDYLPSKAVTEISRAKRRAESLKLGNNLMSMGKKADAYKEFIKAIDITPEMAKLLIEELKRNKIQYVVAPYEADAQLAYLEKQGLIQGVISEDSDLLVFGIKRLLTKLDEYGDCIEINRRDFSALKSIHIAGWTDADFRRMAILSGCDYLPNIEKIGLKTAYQLVRKHKDIDRIIRALTIEGKHTVPVDYLADFRKAELTFLHQRVFCPAKKELVMLSPFLGDEPEDFDFIGKHVDPELARKVAIGDLNPTTKEEVKVVYNAENYRPSPHTLRRSKSVQTPAEMKGKPINEFFRSYRVPLAELDPNSFIPSPSQRRVLERHTGSIVSTPVNMISTRQVTAIASAPAAIGITRSRVTSSGQKISASKRQRLCADDSNSITPAGEIKSPFFTAAPAPSPLQNKESKGKAKDELWSDESFEEALSKMPDDLDTPSNGRKLRIFSETKTAVTEVDPTEDGSQTSFAPSLRTEGSSSSTGSDIHHSFSKSDGDSQPLFPNIKPSTKRMSSSFAELAKKYTLSYEQSSKTKQTSPMLNRSSSSNITQTSAFFTPPISRSSSRLSLTTSATEILYPILPTEPDPEPRLPLLIPESPTSKDNPAPSAIKGSEDYIVPCSDIESEIEEALAWEEEQQAAKESTKDEIDSPSKMKTFGKWNLARFAFTG